jgi:hypothetical protein
METYLQHPRYLSTLSIEDDLRAFCLDNPHLFSLSHGQRSTRPRSTRRLPLLAPFVTLIPTSPALLGFGVLGILVIVLRGIRLVINVALMRLAVRGSSRSSRSGSGFVAFRSVGVGVLGAFDSFSTGSLGSGFRGVLTRPVSLE